MHGVNSEPFRYAAEIEVMRDMGWSWSDLQTAPADLVDTIAESLQASRHWTNEKAKMQEIIRRK